MISKKNTAIIILTGIVLVFILFRFGLFRNSQSDFIQILNKVIVGDVMKVKANNDIDKNKIKINLAFSDKTVFENSHFFDNIGKQYGGPIFDVYYDKKLIGRAFHDNTNNWYTNEFLFNFYKEANRIKFKFNTYGRDKKGEEGYIYIEKTNDSLNFESYDQNHKLINKWSE